MLYLITRNGTVAHSTTDDKAAVKEFEAQVANAAEGDTFHLLQLQADVVQQHEPPPQKPPQGGAPLTADETDQLRKLLDKMHAPAK